MSRIQVYLIVDKKCRDSVKGLIKIFITVLMTEVFSVFLTAIGYCRVETYSYKKAAEALAIT